MAIFAEQLINGWALGSLYALFGIGFGLVFSTLGILNAAHGTYASWAAIAGYYAVERLGVPFPVAVLAGVLAGGLLAVIVDQIAFQPLRARGTGMLGALITSIAFWIILDSLAGFATGQQSLAFPASHLPERHGPDRPHVRPLDADRRHPLAPRLHLGIHGLIQHTRLGAAMRAVGWNEVAAALGASTPES